MWDGPTQLLNSRPPGTKVNIAVLGDSFATGDQQTYDTKVQELLIDGVSCPTASPRTSGTSTVYNLISVDSGVSIRVYDKHVTPDDRPTTRSSARLCGTLRSLHRQRLLGALLAGGLREYRHAGGQLPSAVSSGLDTLS